MSRWFRRSMTLPLIYVSWGVVTIGLPLWLTVCLVLDTVSGDRRFPKARCVLFFVLYLNCEVIGLFASLVIWLVAKICRMNPARTLRWNLNLQIWWTRMLLYGSMRIFSMSLKVENIEQVTPGPILLLVRHSSSADTVLPTVLVSSRYRMRLRFLLKKELLWDPCLDVVGNRLPNVFLDRSGKQTAADLSAIRLLVSTLEGREGVLIYPEGTRFSEPKRKRYVDRLAADAPPEVVRIARRFRHVLPPRPGGTLTALDAAPAAAVVFCKHTGLEGAATFHQFWNGALIGTTIRVAFERVPAEQVPGDPDARLKWLYERWLAVDDWIDDHLSAGPG